MFCSLAIVVGDLQSKKVGPRSHVWSEPGMLEKAANEFADVFRFEEYIQNIHVIYFKKLI